jgi:hypothetical protein
MSVFLFSKIFLFTLLCFSLSIFCHGQKIDSYNYSSNKDNKKSFDSLQSGLSKAMQGKFNSKLHKTSNSLDKYEPAFFEKFPSSLNSQNIQRYSDISSVQKYSSVYSNYKDLSFPNGINKLSSSLDSKSIGKHSKTIEKYSSTYEKFKKRFDKEMANNSIKKYSDYKFDTSIVHNNKYLKKYYDSIKKAIPVIPASPFQKNMSKDELIKQVNDKFLAPQKKQTDTVSKAFDKAQLEKKRIDNDIDLTKAKIQPETLQDLKPIGGSLIKSKYLNKLDSIRKTSLKAERLKFKEAETAAQTKLAYLKNKETFWQKSYFEGIIGIPPGNNSNFQLSPALGFHLSSNISFGAGPNFSFKRDLQKINTTAGLRLFAKGEMFNRQAYLQAEDQMLPHAISIEGNPFTQHNFFAGGGYVIPFLSPLTFNISLMYKVYSNGNVENSTSPWIFRIGFSSVKQINK